MDHPVGEDAFEVFEPWTEPRSRRDSPSSSPAPPMTAADLLREKAIPEITDAARRVQAANHQLLIQDLLDLPDAALRVLFWPRPGQMAGSSERTRVTLEFAVRNGGADAIVAQCWSGDPPTAHTVLGEVPVEMLDLDWVQGRVLDFIEIALASA